MGNNIHILNHPLLQHKLSILRDEHTGTNEFRKVVSEIASLMTYEATRDLPTRDVDVKTPVDMAHCKVLAGKKIAIVPILRAGLGMVDGVLEMLPTAKVGHIGLYRDRRPWILWNTTARCLRTSQSGIFSSLTPCWPPAGSASGCHRLPGRTTAARASR